MIMSLIAVCPEPVRVVLEALTPGYSWTITSYKGLEPGTVELSLVTAGT